MTAESVAVRLKRHHHVRAGEVRIGDITTIGTVTELREPPHALRHSHVSIVAAGAWGAAVTETLMRDCWVALSGMVSPGDRGVPPWDCHR